MPITMSTDIFSKWVFMYSYDPVPSEIILRKYMNTGLYVNCTPIITEMFFFNFFFFIKVVFVNYDDLKKICYYTKT